MVARLRVAAVEDDYQTTVDVMVKVAAIMSGQPLPEAARPIVEAKAREEHRVVIRLMPEWTVYSPPVHLYAGDDASKRSFCANSSLPPPTRSRDHCPG